MTNKTLTIGSRLHGSLRPEDLAQAIVGLYEELGIELDTIYNTTADFVAAWLEHTNDHGDVESCKGTTFGVHFRQCPLRGFSGSRFYGINEAIEDAKDKLQDYAPIYCYVGSIEGDGADFGVWLDHDAIEMAIAYGERQDDGETVINQDDGVRIHVSDHGNIEVYSLETGESLLALV